MSDRILYAIAAVTLLYIAYKMPAICALLVVACFAFVYVYPATRETTASSTNTRDVTARNSTSNGDPPSVKPDAGAPSTNETNEKNVGETDVIPAHRNSQNGLRMESAKQIQTVSAMQSHAEHHQADYRSMNRYLDTVEDEMSLREDAYMSYS